MSNLQFFYGNNNKSIKNRIAEMCNIEINKLARGGMLVFDETVSITPTHLGCLMAKYYLSFKTMDLLTQVRHDFIVISDFVTYIFFTLRLMALRCYNKCSPLYQSAKNSQIFT